MDYKTEAQPKATAGEVPVFCAHDAIVAIEKLIPNPKNPNTHPDAQIQALGRIIRQTGWRAPITVSKRSGFIVKGHGRLAAAKLEGLTEVPVDYQNYTNEAEEYADLVADNRIAELAEIDNKLLADIFADIDTGEIPMELTGYTDKEVESLVTGLAEALHNDLTEPDEIPEAPEGDGMITQKGDLWILGRHRATPRTRTPCACCWTESTRRSFSQIRRTALEVFRSPGSPSEVSEQNSPTETAGRKHQRSARTTSAPEATKR